VAFFRRLSEEAPPQVLSEEEPSALETPITGPNHAFTGRFVKYQLWLPLVAGLLLCATLGILTYRMGIHRGVDVARLAEGTKKPSPVRTNEALAASLRDLDAANSKLYEQENAILDFRRRIEQQSVEIAVLKAADAKELIARQNSDEDKKRLTEDRDHLAEQLTAQQVALQTSEKKLDVLERQRSDEVIHAASLETKVAELSRATKNYQGTVEEQQELLGHDRDIRELMGARDLYVAEVYDVARTGETQKAFGRVFYTKEKSLIFYAYDLDGAPGWKDAHTFQAWGTHGPNRAEATNLGMFYEDNVSKNRWVLKFNDKKTLKQIDAVFVTVEPHGGSEKPSGKPFLFAYLRMNSNHP
jgi:hypothetical protein